jgi:hypothetical protein
MRLLNELRLRRDVSNAIAIPMMTTASDQILRVQVGREAGWRVVGMVAKIKPYIRVLRVISVYTLDSIETKGALTSIDECKTVCTEVEAAIFSVLR